jgi:hypothetical protein
LGSRENFSHTWKSSISIGSDEFRIVASEELRARGYNVLGGDNLLFGEDESAKAQYQLGGTLTGMEYNTFGSHAGNFSDANVQIEWQVYNVLASRGRIQRLDPRLLEEFGGEHGVHGRVPSRPFEFDGGGRLRQFDCA